MGPPEGSLGFWQLPTLRNRRHRKLSSPTRVVTTARHSGGKGRGRLTHSGILNNYPPHFEVYLRYTVDSKKLEYGPGTIYVGCASSRGFEVGGQSYSNFLASTL